MASIAIIGSGISGMGAAYLLHPHHEITLYEKSAAIGGHTRTRTVQYDGTAIAVDTGFIVFNYKNYPELAGLFDHLGVKVQKSNMTFAVTIDQGALEWGATNLNSVFGQRRNLLRPKFWRLIRDVLRFNRLAARTAAAHPQFTLGELIRHLGMGDWFARYYILPMGGAIWSCSLADMLKFPASVFISFFKAHGLLTLLDQPQWYTVTGGSQEYVKLLTAPFRERIRANCGAVSVTRTDGKAQLKDAQGRTEQYDHVVFACHADEALAALGDATAEEKDILRAFGYQKNHAVLHRDVSIMPKRRRCWASWVYHSEPPHREDKPLSVTYWMNKLQSIDDKYPLFVTLNPEQPIAPGHIFEEHEFTHPIYSQQAIAAQTRLPALQGKQNSWFCGAYHRYGFHEDGLQSAVNVAKLLGIEAPWH